MNPTCSICLNPLKLSDAATIPCGHCFHADCIFISIEAHKESCPLCNKKAVATDIIKLFFSEDSDPQSAEKLSECDIIDLSRDEDPQGNNAGSSSMALSMLTDKIKDLEAKCARSSSFTKILERDYERLQASNAEMTEQLEVESDRLEELDEMLIGSKLEAESYRDEAQKYKEMYESAKTKLDRKVEEAKQLRTDVNRLRRKEKQSSESVAKFREVTTKYRKAEERATKAEERAKKAEESVRSLKKWRSSLSYISNEVQIKDDKGIKARENLESVKNELKSLIPKITKSKPVVKKSPSQFRGDSARKPSSSSPPKRQKVTRLLNL